MTKQQAKLASVVLIEDDENLSRYVADALRDSGFEVFQAFDGEVGFELVKSKLPDLVLLDLLLPKKDGVTVLIDLKHLPETRSIPVIIVSMLDGEEDVRKTTVEFGAAGYIVKSHHSTAEIVQIVKNSLGKRSK